MTTVMPHAPSGTRRRTRLALLLSAAGALILSSCATTYGAMSNRGGYRDFQESKTQYHVYFLANANTPKETAYRFFLTRAAQIAIKRGYPYFYVYHLKDSTRSQTYVTPGASRTYYYQSVVPPGVGPFGFFDPQIVGHSVTVYQPPTYSRVDAPGYEGQILLVKKRIKGQQPPFDARMLYREGMQLNDRIKAANLKTGVTAGIGTAIVIGVAAVAAFFGSGGTISFTAPVG